ncbi:alpha/beta hydrolase [Opitutaceae bacterium]|nr:alpha/beta hydrolase [Opitutaceae bacterium]
MNATGGLPLIIWVHGGGWKCGSKNGINRCVGMLERGYAIASVEYRLSGEALFPAAVEDCEAAVSFLRLNAKKFGLDPDRFGTWGSSAGGHLVAMLNND